MFGSGERRQRTDRLLKAITVQARAPEFYERLGVPDTLDGRFDLMALHGFIVFRTLNERGRDGRRLAQDTTDLMFSAFDDAIRSLGVGDMGVPRRVKTMAKAYFGRSSAYDAALKTGDLAALGLALQRNLYRGRDGAAGMAEAVAAYVMREADRLKSLPLERFQSGDLGFGEPPGAVA
jgi:cytochrome b pre-mRNA-processing protein 3